jgi:DNA-directed RNA polymerase subunit H (RpoH/RPB5)
MEYVEAYNAFKNYAAEMGLKLEFGYYTTKTKTAEYLEGNKILSEININYFIISRYEGDHYICVIKTEAMQDSSKLRTIVNICRGFQNLLIVTADTQNTKLTTICGEFVPKMNFISVAAFKNGVMNNICMPAQIKKIDYEAEKDIVMCEKNNLMEIHFHDPVCAWFNFKPGDVIAILNRSFVSGFNTHYRVVKYIV